MASDKTEKVSVVDLVDGLRASLVIMNRAIQEVGDVDKRASDLNIEVRLMKEQLIVMKDQLVTIKQTVDSLDKFIHQGNGESLSTRVSLLEQTNKALLVKTTASPGDSSAQVEKVRGRWKLIIIIATAVLSGLGFVLSLFFGQATKP